MALHAGSGTAVPVMAQTAVVVVREWWSLMRALWIKSYNAVIEPKPLLDRRPCWRRGARHRR
jgi:hypothetical protein